jgi:hypothetical protein
MCQAIVWEAETEGEIRSWCFQPLISKLKIAETLRVLYVSRWIFRKKLRENEARATKNEVVKSYI